VDAVRLPPTGSTAVSFGVGAIAIVGAVGIFALIGFLGFSPIAAREDLPEVKTRARPLIRAIDRFIASEGRPPASLDELLPNYLDQIPTPLSAARPHFSYFKSPEARLEAGCWELVVWCGGGLDLDSNEQLLFQSKGRSWRYCPK